MKFGNIIKNLIKMENKQTPVEWLENQLKKTHWIEWNKIIQQAKEMEKEQSTITENTSDGYHTFKELYEFRKIYNATLFNEWGKQMEINPKWVTEDNQPVNLPKYDVHKSWRHNDGELCFGGGWFIVVANLPSGQISNHYQAHDWDLFDIPVYEKAKYPFDGHTSRDVIDRLKKLK
jgi:hypothetical protein